MKRIPAAGIVLDGDPSDHDPFLCDFLTEEGTPIRAVTYNGAKHDAEDLRHVYDALEDHAVGVALLQEVKRDKGNRDVVRDLRRRGYRVVYAKPEFAIAYNPQVWKKLRSWRPLMSPTKYWTINYALVVVLEHRTTGEIGKFVSVHPPAHVQAPKHPSFPVVSRVVREWKVTLDRIARRNFERTAERKGGIDFVCAAGDLNIDHTKGYKPPSGGWAWLLSGPLTIVDPPKGTRGARKIDKFLVRGLSRRRK